jgi:hypothetical protein
MSDDEWPVIEPTLPDSARRLSKGGRPGGQLALRRVSLRMSFVIK